jgi:hypothetical protein
MFDNPSARTDHGELPVVETNKRPSPNPNKDNPVHKSKKVVNLGFKFKGFSELQDFEGIFLMVKNIILKTIYLLNIKILYKVLTT